MKPLTEEVVLEGATILMDTGLQEDGGRLGTEETQLR